MGKKNIDKLFQEKFKDFGEVPDEKVWNSIENSLNKKKKKRVVPIWWKLGGAAAVLAIALIALNPFEDAIDKNPVITDTKNSNNEKQPTEKDVQENVLQIPKGENNTIVNDSSDGEMLRTNTDQESEKQKLSSKDSDTNMSNASYNKDALTLSNNAKPKNTSITTTDTRTNDGGEKSGKPNPKTEKESIENLKSDVVIATSSTTQIDKSTDIVSDTMQNDGIGIAQTLGKAEKDSNMVTSKKTIEGLANADTKVVENSENSTDVDSNDSKKKSILEVIKAQDEEEKLVEASNGRWSAGPSIAPVYFNAIGQGSPVHSSFSPNSKSGNTNLSYGLSVAYEINKKLSIRSGIHKVDYGYDTDGVEFSSALQATTGEKIDNIDYAVTSKNLVVTSKATNLSGAEFANNDATLELSASDSNARDGVMAQQFGYLELPLELDYALIDRKFGLNLTGGLSSLFLVNNSVTVTSGELTTEVGEANNVNNVNFSTNIGFGVNYKFTPKIRFNIEPIFKYQLNTFSDVSGDFQPFSIGVYSGLNFKF